MLKPSDPDCPANPSLNVFAQIPIANAKKERRKSMAPFCKNKLMPITTDATSEIKWDGFKTKNCSTLKDC